MTTESTGTTGTIGFDAAPDEQEVDVAIIGAGVSGLYCAYQLLKKNPDQKIAIVERLNRTGGRLDSDLIDIEGGGTVREEEGGMRFNHDMVELMRLFAELKLPDDPDNNLCTEMVPFPMSSPDNTNRFHLRGQTFTKAEAIAGCHRIWGEIYELNENERGQSPTQLVVQAFHRVLEANPDKQPMPDNLTPDDWTCFRNTFEWKGLAMNQWQMWGLLRDMGHSEECIQMLSETIGFAGPFKAPINAGDGFQLLADFPKDPAYLTFKNGFSTLPNALKAAIETNCQIMLSTNVDTITHTDATNTDGTYTLTMTEAPDQLNSSTHIPGGTPKTITAPKLIVAVATAGMERLFQTSPALNQHPKAEKLWESIHGSRGMKLMKINLYFEEQWWKDGTVTPAVEFGPNFTSLPVNAVYPFYAEDDGTAGALTIYCDFNNTNFWAGLQGPKDVREPFSSPLQDKENAKVPQTLYGASRAVVDEAKHQLRLLFGINDVPEPVLTSYRLWDGAEDFEYAYHQWRVGVDDRGVREFLAAPGDDLYFCNESISDMQGWVNGSLRSCDAVLKSFGIEPLDGDVCPTALEPPVTAAPAAREVTGLWGA